MAGLTFVLSGGAAVLARYGGHALPPCQTGFVLSLHQDGLAGYAGG